MKKRFLPVLMLLIICSMGTFADVVEDFSKAFEKSGVQFDFVVKVAVTGLGQEMEFKGSMAMKGENALTDIDMGMMKLRMLKIGKDIYMLNDAQKNIMKLPSDQKQQQTPGMIDNFSNMKKVGEGKGEINGKTLPYLEYTTNGAPSKFYIENNKIYAIEGGEEGVKSQMILSNLKDSVPDSTFQFPSGYKKVGF
jgi:hypothetical protein